MYVRSNHDPVVASWERQSDFHLHAPGTFILIRFSGPWDENSLPTSQTVFSYLKVGKLLFTRNPPWTFVAKKLFFQGFWSHLTLEPKLQSKFQSLPENSRHFILWLDERKVSLLACLPNSLLAWRWRLIVDLETWWLQNAAVVCKFPTVIHFFANFLTLLKGKTLVIYCRQVH